MSQTKLTVHQLGAYKAWETIRANRASAKAEEEAAEKKARLRKIALKAWRTRRANLSTSQTY
jgi:hypothetical protein